MFKLFLLYLFTFLIENNATTIVRTKEKSLTISMPLVKTTYSDQYICYAMPLDDIDEEFVMSSLTEADRSVVHHVATGVCDEPVSSDPTWDCTQSQGRTCKGDAVNFGGWDEFSKKNGIFEFPKDVSLRIGRKTRQKYFIMEIHYMEPVRDPKHSAANVTLSFAKSSTKYNYQTYSLLNGGFIPANTNKGFFSDVACKWTRPTTYAFRYFLHTHHYGILVEGFLIRNNSWTLIGSQLSMGKNKDLYDVPGGPMEIRKGDVIAARCLYLNHEDKPVKFGMSEGEEMCNFQIDIGYDPKYEEHFRRPPACVTQSPDFSFCDHAETSGLCSK